MIQLDNCVRNLFFSLSIVSITVFVPHHVFAAHHANSSVAKETVDLGGRVMNGTHNKPGPGGLEVRLIHLGKAGVRTLGVTKTSNEGRFQFSNLKVPEGKGHVLLVTLYQGVPYIVMPRMGSRSNRLPIYAVGSDSSKVHVDSHQILVRVEKERLVFRESLRLNNFGNTTYVSSGDGTLTFDLPRGAKLLHFPEGLNQKLVKITSGRVESSEPILPGTRQINLIYSISSPSSKLSVERRVQFHTKQFKVMTMEFGMREPISSDLDYTGVFGEDLGDRFHVASGGGFSRGKLVQFTISRDVRNASIEMIFLVFTGMVIVVLVLLFTIRRRRFGVLKVGQSKLKNSSVSMGFPLSEEAEENLRKERDELLHSIMALDYKLEAGQIQESEYIEERSALKLRAIEVMRKIGKP